jgi:DNA-binding IclR family transcriptional regulator
MDITKYPPSTQLERVALILRVLFDHGGTGLTPGAIATATKLGASYVTQQLGQLANLKFVEEVGDTGRWRPGVAWAQMATAQHIRIQRDLDSLREYQQRITRT